MRMLLLEVMMVTRKTRRKKTQTSRNKFLFRISLIKMEKARFILNLQRSSSESCGMSTKKAMIDLSQQDKPTMKKSNRQSG